MSLISAVPITMAALDGHRGVAAVVEHALVFLKNLSAAAENRARWAFF